MWNARNWLNCWVHDSRVCYFFRLQESNAMKPSREMMWDSNQNRRQKVFNRGYYICAGGLDILKILSNLHWFVVFYISIWGLKTLIWGIGPTKRAFVIFFLFLYFLSLWGRALWLSIGEVTFACYSRSPISLIFLAWEQYKLTQVLNSNLISEWLSKRKLKWKESHLKIAIELYLIETLTRLLHLFRRSNYV